MSYDIRKIRNITDLIGYFSENLNWAIDIDDFDDIEDISYDFEAEDIGLKEESFAKISALRQLQPLVDGQQWGIFCIEFDSNKFEVSALRKILSKFVPKRRSMVDHAVWQQQDLLFICNWGENNNRTIGIAHFEDKEKGLPQIKMISCAPALEDFTQIRVFEERLAQLAWPKNTSDIEAWRKAWSNAFSTGYKQIIKDSSTLTIRLAAEAQNIRNRILEILDVETSNGYVHLLYDKFRNTLIHDMSETQFADMYAQTVVYGLFSARCMDQTQNDFSAEEAIQCIPRTNPFLKKLMKECLGTEKGGKLSFDELEIGNIVELLLHTKTEEIIRDFNRQTGGGKEDPVIHFYEEFLTAYDKAQKVQRGVYYTPQPVVTFMVKAVDDLIRTEFGLSDGLASKETRKIKVKQLSKRKINGVYKNIEVTKEVPAVQILDPATGTGTFLRQIIIQIYRDVRDKYPKMPKEDFLKIWNQYVPEHMLTRVTGFELMMAPYAVAHMKLAMILKDSGYDFYDEKRLQVYLTNTLEKPGNASMQLTLFDDPLASESIEANDKKKNSRISIIIGNPPYSGESANKNEWIMEMMDAYKKEPGGVIKLKERNPKWINDDYVKFIRYAQSIIDSTGEGILAYICPHGFLDNPTFRGMRWNLLKSFNKVYIIDLHGNINKHETAPDGSKDENVFDIQQGVCIMLAVKNKGYSFMGEVYHAQLYGLRDYKYDMLRRARMEHISFKKVSYSDPQYCFIPRKNEGEDEYKNFFSLKELFPLNSMGIVTAKDKVLIGFTKEELATQVSDYYHIDVDIELMKPINYRPFDNRFVYYATELIERSRENVMTNFGKNKNIGLVFRRQSPDTMPISYFYVCDSMMADGYIRSDNKGGETVAPLYVYENTLLGKRKYNLSQDIVNKIELQIGLKLVDSTEFDQNKYFSGEELIQYIYAILYSESYRSKFGEFIKIDFPRVPFPKSAKHLRLYAKYGKELMNAHLQKEGIDNKVQLQGEGSNQVELRKFVDNKVYINKTQYFTEVTESIWNSYLGGYQPLQKWLKDRKGKILSSEDISVYIRMIEAIEKTELIQQKIDLIERSF